MAPAAGFPTLPRMYGKNEVRIAYVLKQEDLELAVEVLVRGARRLSRHVAEMKELAYRATPTLPG